MYPALNPDLDIAALKAAFLRDGRVTVRNFLTDDAAQALHTHLTTRTDWRVIMNAGDTVYEMPIDAFDGLTAEKRRELDEKIGEAACWGFQYRFANIRVADAAEERDKADTPLDRFAQFLSSPPARDLLRAITGQDGIAFADAQATLYRAGDLLTRHDDDVAGKHRLAAYVYGLTPQWRPEWGGLLLFHGAEGDIEGGLSPGFNCLRLFAVPQDHSVSQVTAFAGEARLSVTGWLRES